jgi:hypothetical protein
LIYSNYVYFSNIEHSNYIYNSNLGNYDSNLINSNYIYFSNIEHSNYIYNSNLGNYDSNLINSNYVYISNVIYSHNSEIWRNSNNNVYLLLSNVGIGKSNPSYPLDVVGTIQCSNIIGNSGAFTNLFAANAQINNAQIINDAVNNITCAKGLFNNIVGINGVFETLTINQSITYTNPINTQVFNTIIKSGSSQSLFTTVSWSILNTTYPNHNIFLEITHDISTASLSGHRSEKMKINTYGPSVISDNSANAMGDVSAFTSLFIFNTTTSNSVTFESRSTLNSSDIILHNMNLNVILIPQFIGNIILT